MIPLDELTEVGYLVERGLAWITINRPEVYNAYRGRTVDELITCFKKAWVDRAVGVVALTGAGDRAFCAGGDQKQRRETGDYGPTESGLFESEALHRMIRDTYLARLLGEKRAREVWFLCRRYDAVTMQRWGLVNAVVPLERRARRCAHGLTRCWR